VRNRQIDISQYESLLIASEANSPELQISKVYGNSNPLEVDIGSGKGRFLLARAAEHPNTNFLGIERQRGRVYRAAKKAINRNLTNVRLCPTEAVGGITEMLPDESVSTFYIFFPDPWPKRRHHDRRLVTPVCLDLLHSKLIPDGQIHFASDHEEYSDVVAHRFADDARFKPIPAFEPNDAERTDFEIIFTGQNKPINRHSIQKC
jgi:tRNA (guanine-N7-)-methyltransferase